MNLKKVVTGNELKEKMVEAINLLCNTVKTTLGPKGNNIIIDHSAFSPYITNDGVTIAQNIESEDQVTNTILELAKEASLKTDENVGDGTTTTLVLLQSIFNNGLKELEKGINPLTLKNELQEEITNIITEIKTMSRKATKKELQDIATIAANDSEIGKIITESYLKVKQKEAIIITESDKMNTTVEHYKGYTFQTELASPYFLLNSNNLTFANPKLLLINNYLTDISNIEILINEIIATKVPLLIIAKEYSETFINQAVESYLNNSIQICLLKISEYGNKELNILTDISTISNSKIFNDEYSIDISKIGLIENVKINKDETNITFSTNKNIRKRINEVVKQLKNAKDDITIDFNQKRIAMLKKGLITIKVGASTTTERREKKMRFDDCLCAVTSTDEGIVPGSGLTLYKISEQLIPKTPAKRILNKALKEPLQQILTNSAVNIIEVINTIQSSNYEKLYNIKNRTYENIETTSVIDPTKVVINTLVNACSIATMLLTTNSLIINEYKTNIKRDEYTEI